jgi:hypothetical protein
MTELQKQSMATLETLAEEINDYHAKCEAAVGQAVAYAMEAGDRLAKVKEGLGHGEWLPWLEQNFKGTPRTAQAYMRVAANRTELEKRSSASHLSIRGALKELSAPSSAPGEEDELDEDSPATDEQVVELVRLWMEMEGPTELSDVEQEAFERRLAKPGERERDLLKAIHFEYMMYCGCMVSQDGFFLEEHDGKTVIDYREDDKLYRLPLVEPGKQRLDEKFRPRIQRGARVIITLRFLMGRLLSNWFTEMLIAEVDDLEKVEQRIMHNADWKQAEPAGEYLRDKLLHKGFDGDRKLDMKKWALRHQVLDFKELKYHVYALDRVLLRLDAKGYEDRLMGGEPPASTNA